MEDSYLTQRWLFEMLEKGEDMSLLRWTIFICIPSEISWEMGSPLLRRSFTRVERIAGFCSDRVEPGPRGEKGSWTVSVQSGASVARTGACQTWWLESVARIGGF